MAFIVIFTSGNDGAFTVAAGWLVDDDGLYGWIDG